MILYSTSFKIYLKENGWRWIRTTEANCSRFTVCPLWPLGNPSIFIFQWIKPMIGLEPITCWLQISCSANWATSAYDLWLLTQRIAVLKMTPTGFEPVLPPWKGDVLTAWPWGQVFKSSSPSRARTYNPSVNSRVLYHWAIEEYHLVNHGVLVNNNTFDLKMQVLFYLYLQNFTQKASNLTPSNNQRLFQSKLYSLLCMP